MLDACATKSFISKELATFLKPRTEPYRGEPIITGDGSPIFPKYSCKLEFKIGDRLFNHNFIVLEKSPFKIILGVEFIEQADILMDIPNGIFWFRNKPNDTCKFMRFRNHEFLCALQGLSQLQENELSNVISEYPEVFSDTLGCTDLVQCKLEIEGPPIAQPAYPISNKKRKIMREHIQEMLKLGIIVPSDSEWASPVSLHSRDGGQTFRFVGDFRKLNMRMKSDPYPFNRMDAILHRLGEARFLSVIDLKKGFWQIKMHPDSMKYTSFVCEEGKFMFTRACFGLKVLPALFVRLVNKVLGEAKVFLRTLI